MAVPRDAPYVWVTWLTGILSGDSQCGWRAWFKANHRYDRRPSDFNLAAWSAEHANFVASRAEELRSSGYEARVEGENDFKLRGRNGVTVAGKPDLVAFRGEDALICDCKTGQERNADKVQVLLYMLLLPHAVPAYRKIRFRGDVSYRQGRAAIPANAVDLDFRDRFAALVNALAATDGPARAPSFNECRFCDLTADDCDERVDAIVPVSATDLF